MFNISLLSLLTKIKISSEKNACTANTIHIPPNRLIYFFKEARAFPPSLSTRFDSSSPFTSSLIITGNWPRQAAGVCCDSRVESAASARLSAGNAMSSSSQLSQVQLDATAVENFREYLRIPSVQPNINYAECVAFLQKQAKSLDLLFRIYYVHRNKPIVVLTWIGTDSSESAILLNSHMDVVPVVEDKWTYPPFSAHMDEQGNIYARGSQDMKCVGIQYLEAVRRLKAAGQHFKRTIHISFVPDEEIGGILGMKDFVHTKDFKALNVGFALDEGVACPEEHFYMFYGERSIWHVAVECAGRAGHGSILLDNTAGEKVRVVIDRFMDYRAKEKEKLKDPKVQLGDVTTINLTQLKGGIQTNVVPTSFTAIFDVRLDPSVDHSEFEAMIKKWCQEAGPDVTYSFEQKNPKIENTRLDDSNPFWTPFKKTCDDLGITLQMGIFPGGTDSRYVRQVGIPAIGFSPMNNTKILLHDHDEYLNKNTFLKGIGIYMKIIATVSSV